MKKLYYALAFIASFLFFLDIFLPKERALAAFVSHLGKSGVSVNKTEKEGGYEIKTNGMSFEIKEPSVSSFLYITKLEANSFSSPAFFDFNASNVEVENSLLSPSKFKLSARSKYGDIDGDIDASSNKVRLNIKANKEFENIKTALGAITNKELEKIDGGYSVEFSY